MDQGQSESGTDVDDAPGGLALVVDDRAGVGVGFEADTRGQALFRCGAEQSSDELLGLDGHCA